MERATNFLDEEAADQECRRVAFNDQGLVCAVVQQVDSLEVLMVAWMNREALKRTLMTGRAWYWSRSRQDFWRKGDTSGNRQYVRSMALDCDGDALLVRVDQIGPACHTGTVSCFTGREVSGTYDLPRDGLTAGEPTSEKGTS